MSGSRSQWEEWGNACRGLGIEVSDAQLSLFARFYDMLVEVNQTVNLTRITALEDFLDRHLLDSLSVSPLIPQNVRVADIGSGAGFPAIPLAILRPDLEITAIESTGKKCRFIEDVKAKLELDHLHVVAERGETLGQDPHFREKFDVTTARAVAELRVLLELCLPLTKTGGLFLAMKGLSFQAELDASKRAIATLGGRFVQVHTFSLSQLSGSRVLQFEKVKVTPAGYPRSPGTPSKKPL